MINHRKEDIMARKGEKWLWQSPANFITISRVPLGIGVYYFLANHNISTALALFALGVIADTVDGPIARKMGTISDTGKVLDQVCDAIFVMTSAAGAVKGEYASLWACGIPAGLAVISYMIEQQITLARHPLLTLIVRIRPFVYGLFFPALPMVVAWGFVNRRTTFVVWGIVVVISILFLIIKWRRITNGFFSPLKEMLQQIFQRSST